MHLGSLESTQEARNALGYRLVQLLCIFRALPSLETQGQIVGARESLNERENMARKKVKNGEKDL